MKHFKKYYWQYCFLYLLFYQFAKLLFPDLTDILAAIGFWSLVASLLYTIYYWISYWLYVRKQKK
ncbi:hypothetical protein [Streptococcus iners]|uniref:Uncharacterized protein n=1 Tax=Streptococcus iners TaxID=3028084 RepID=A0AA97A2S2_9STRE|nr:hypothetical protein [Streptococcus sp. 29887]MCK4024785.1 hypothetical protein [Streptococcus suis]NQN49705.1 hypothetical protein [Streptococcus suis]NQO84416.1 hypothetical protein [Streptococcus suis]WNY51047.1 hypothetical protein PW252_10845 [Streptococcus sp. 29887]HEM5489986.1 hypothetical protein [Streptococcus suis]